MFTSAKLLYVKVRKLHKEVYEQLLDLRRDIKDCVNETELADSAFALKNAIELLEDIRKELSKTSKHSKNVACLVWIEKQASSMNGEPIRTTYCTARPDVKEYVPYPSKKDKEGWYELMEWMGIPKNVAERELVRPHFNSMVDFCTELQSQGKDLPPGLDPDKKVPQYDLLMRKTKVGIA